VKMLATCFSTAPSEITSAPAMAALERPSAMRESTSFSRALKTEMEAAASRGPQELGDHFGVEGRPAGGHPHQGFDEVAHIGHSVFEQVPDPRRVVGQELRGVAGLDVLREQQDPQPFVGAAELNSGAQAPHR